MVGSLPGQSLHVPNNITIASLSEHTTLRVHEQTSDEPDICSICRTQIEPGSVVRELRCSHFYHPHCIDQWISSHDSCPICREKILP